MRKPAKPKVKLAHPMDVALGNRIREVREAAQVSQIVMGREMGITFQQIQKYETASNRISFSRLCEMADVLDITVIDLIKPVVEGPHDGPA